MFGIFITSGEMIQCDFPKNMFNFIGKTSSTNCGRTGLPRCAPYLQLLDQLGREIWTKVLEM